MVPAQTTRNHNGDTLTLWRKTGALLMAAVVSLAFLAQAVSADWKQIKIATEGAYPPWNYFDESGKLVGFEIDLLKDLCGRMNLECEIVTQKWRGIIEGLNKGKYDAIVAAMSITAPRKEKVTFSRSYADTPNIFIVRKDNPLANFKSEIEHLTLDELSPAEQAALDALVNALKGKVIGVQVATIFQKFADQYLGEHSEIRIYDFQYTVDLELYQGRLDALVGDMAYWAPVLKSEQGKEYKIIGPQMTGGPFGSGIGVAVRKKDQALADMFSTAIDAALRDGTVKKLSIEWFTFDTSAPQ
ncbi:MAG: transporter substrate-binding domain-containing protein [Deltaproteobacteria bacterium]|jgi:octopine/nopaline transport system substrate-binding protein|nr:transporter substrate-binding domain-containing protein [Deltaproteobacteria bacterium]